MGLWGSVCGLFLGFYVGSFSVPRVYIVTQHNKAGILSRSITGNHSVICCRWTEHTTNRGRRYASVKSWKQVFGSVYIDRLISIGSNIGCGKQFLFLL